MTKIYSFRRLLSCFTATSTAPTTSSTTTTKKRLSTSLRDDIQDRKPHHHHRHGTTTTTTTTSSATSRVRDKSPDTASSTTSNDAASTTSNESVSSHAPPRPSKSMVICTFFGHRRSHVWFCVQLDRLSSKPSLLLELSLSTQNLIKEMQSGLLRIALESERSDLGHCPLHSIPVWTLYCNGRKIGFASRRKSSDETRSILKKMQNMTVGAGVIPSSGSESRSDLSTSDQGGDVMYMRANYEWVVGGADSESYHLISPDDDCPGQDLSVFLFRTRK